MKLNKRFQTTEFFLTTYFDNHEYCVAIPREKTGIRMRNRLRKDYVVIEKGGYVYVMNKGD